MSWYSFFEKCSSFDNVFSKNPGIKKDHFAAVECVVKYAQKNFLKFVEKAIDL